jgi:DNA phosphorothioation-dependent restriction protein DptH
LLVAGTTGSGKSEALNAILFGLVKNYSPTELKLLLVDPKGTELLPFENTPYLLGNIGWDDVDAIQLLTQAVEEMQTRYTLFRENKTRSLAEYNATISDGLALPWWLIVLDEYADLTSDPQMKKDIENLLKRLAQKARASGIHVIIATQKPSADVISTNLRSNLPAQLALRVKSSTESRVVLDEAGAEALNGKGDALLKADGKLIRVQCARVGVKDQVVPS